MNPYLDIMIPKFNSIIACQTGILIRIDYDFRGCGLLKLYSLETFISSRSDTKISRSNICTSFPKGALAPLSKYKAMSDNLVNKL